MTSDQTGKSSEETLDPGDWQAMRALGHQMVDDMLSYLETVRERPVWQPIPERVKGRIRQPLPLEPEAPEEVYQEFMENILPYPLGNLHPRFWGWAMGNGTPLAMLAEMLAAAMNPNPPYRVFRITPETPLAKQPLRFCRSRLTPPIACVGCLCRRQPNGNQGKHAAMWT